MPKQKALTPIDEIRFTLSKLEPQFKKALPIQINPEKFTRVLVTAIQNKPELLLCTKQSIYSAAMLAAQDGLLPDGREGAIIPYGKEAKWMPMIGGILKKVRNSGELASLNPGIIYEEDEFTYWVDENGPHMKHIPCLDEDKGEMIHVYCTAQIKNGSNYIEIMSKSEIEKVRSMSKAKSGPWFDWYLEMAKKTVIRRLSKRLPVSTDLQSLIERDDDLYQLKDVQEIKQTKVKSSRLSKMIEESEEPEIKTVVKKGDKGFTSETQSDLPTFGEFNE